MELTFLQSCTSVAEVAGVVDELADADVVAGNEDDDDEPGDGNDTEDGVKCDWDCL